MTQSIIKKNNSFISIINLRKKSIKIGIISPFLLLTFLLIATFNSLKAQDTTLQLNYSIRPDYSMGYIGWELQIENEIEPNSYNVQIDIQSVDASGMYTYTTIDSWTQIKKYFQLDEFLSNDPNVFVKIKGLSTQGLVTVEGDYLQVYDVGFKDNEPIAPGGPIVSTTAEWKCNGIDYAYEIVKNEQLDGRYYLSMHATGLWDPITKIGTPFYWYFDETNRSASAPIINPLGSNHGIPEKLRNNGKKTYFYGAAHKYVNYSGTLIPGPTIGGIEKFPEQFEGKQSSTNPSGNTWQMPNQSFNSTSSLNYAIQQFNSYTSAISRSVLTCVPYPRPQGASVSQSDNWNAWITNLHKWVGVNEPIQKWVWKCVTDSATQKKKCKYVIVKENGSQEGNPNNSFFKNMAKGDPAYSAEFSPSEDDLMPVSKYTSFIVTRIDEYENPIILDPENIYKSDGTIEEPELELDPEGLYRLQVFVDNLDDPIPFMGETEDANFSTVQTKANLTSISAFPVPITGNSVSFSIDSPTNESINYEIKNSSGTILVTSQTYVTESVVKEVTEGLGTYNNSFPELIICTFTFQDNSTKILKLLKY